MVNTPQTEKTITGVKALVFDPERKSVLFLRRRRNNKLTLLGGQVKGIDTSLQGAFKREYDEEIVLDHDPDVAFHLLALHKFRANNGRSQIVVNRVIGHFQTNSKELTLKDEAHTEGLWVPTTDLTIPQRLAELAMEETLIESLPILFNEEGGLRDNPINASVHVWPLPAITLR